MNRNTKGRKHFTELTLPQVKTLVTFCLGLAPASRHPLASDRGEGLANPARPSLWTPFGNGFDRPRIPAKGSLLGMSKGYLQC